MTAQSLKQRVARGSGGGMGLSFGGAAVMLGEKMVSKSFGGAAGHGERAPGAGAAHPTTMGASKRVS